MCVLNMLEKQPRVRVEWKLVTQAWTYLPEIDVTGMIAEWKELSALRKISYIAPWSASSDWL